MSLMWSAESVPTVTASVSGMDGAAAAPLSVVLSSSDCSIISTELSDSVDDMLRSETLRAWGIEEPLGKY